MAFLAVAQIATGAGVHRCRKHKIGWEGQCAVDARNRDLAVLQRLAHNLKRIALKFRQLI